MYPRTHPAAAARAACFSLLVTAGAPCILLLRLDACAQAALVVTQLRLLPTASAMLLSQVPRSWATTHEPLEDLWLLFSGAPRRRWRGGASVRWHCGALVCGAMRAWMPPRAHAERRAERLRRRVA